MEDEFDKRFSAAKTHRASRLDEEGREIYKFAFNGREIEWDGRRGQRNDPEEIFADAVSEVAEEFTGELFSTMTPENTPWVEYTAGTAIPEDEAENAREAIEAREKAISKAITASNYYHEGPTAFQDVIVGNAGIWIDQLTFGSPAVCEAVPLSETYLRLGPGGIADRFRKKKYYGYDLPALFPDADFPQVIKDKMKGKTQVTVIWGFWPTYKDPKSPVWRQEIRVDNKTIGLDKDLDDPAAVPFIVGRFNPQPNSPYGRGPARRMLPSLRVYDEMVRMNLEAMDRNLDPAYVYPHDGMLDLSDGIESGLGYPAMPGSSQEIRAIGVDGQLDYGFFSEERMYEALRRGFYRGVEQRGKTPPSASQYMGQEQKEIRRMARPAGPLWNEWGVGVLKRFEYLEMQPGGSLEGQPQLLDGKIISLRPISPLERAQAREEVMAAQSIMGMAVENLGEQAGLLIDGPTTFRNIKAKMKDTLVEFRTEEQLQQMAQAMQQMQQQQPQEPPNG